MNLTRIKQMAETVHTSPDTRPDWLKRTCMGHDGWLYYRFFSAFSNEYGPARIVDIGTHIAGSCAHLAFGNPASHVWTMDPDPNSACIVASLPVKNITAFTGTSMALADQIRRSGPFDIVVIDGEHHINHMYPEYVCYRSMVKNGGFIFFDDVNYDQFPTMRTAWDLIPDPKLLLPTLHFSGFGVCQVDHAIHALALRDALRRKAQQSTA